MDNHFLAFIYFLVGLYVAHFFVKEFDGVGTFIVLALAFIFIFWPVFIITWSIIAIKDMHKRR